MESSKDVTIACLKHGSFYSAHYVNVLKNMVQRHCSYSIRFICFTENPHGIDPEIEILPLPNLSLSGKEKAWWYKLKIFDKTLGYTGTVLFLDLDIVIIKSIDKFFEYYPKKFCIIDDYATKGSSIISRNSSVFRMEFGSYPRVWDLFIKNQDKITSRLHGDQDWITEQINDEKIWPDDWAISYRWDYAAQKRALPEECSILVFHGPPKPHEVVFEGADSLILKHWK